MSIRAGGLLLAIVRSTASDARTDSSMVLTFVHRSTACGLMSIDRPLSSEDWHPTQSGRWPVV